jgi:hypothetical protein
MMNRTAPDASPVLAFTPLEIRLLDHLAKNRDTRSPQTKSISTYLNRIARLGGYLAHAGDAAPGNAVIWKGLSRLTDIELGFVMGAELVGN